jgi:hypothetical protein
VRLLENTHKAGQRFLNGTHVSRTVKYQTKRATKHQQRTENVEKLIHEEQTPLGSVMELLRTPQQQR